MSKKEEPVETAIVKIPSIAAVAHKYSIGVRADIRPCIQWIDDSSVVYVCGSNIILLNTESRAQKFMAVSSSGGPSAIVSGAVGATASTLNEDFCIFSAIALAPGKRFLALAASTLPDLATNGIVIYDIMSMRKRKFLPLPTHIEPTMSGSHVMLGSDAGSKNVSQSNVYKEPIAIVSTVFPIIAVAFSGDSKCVAALTCEGPMIYTWAWEKGKVLGSVRVPTMGAPNIAVGISGSMSNLKKTIPQQKTIINTSNGKPVPCTWQVSYSPNDSSLIAAVFAPFPHSDPLNFTGGMLKTFKLADGTLKAVAPPQKNDFRQQYFCHCWLSDTRVLGGSAGGHLTILESGEFKCDFINLSSSGKPLDVHHIVSFTRGFICGCQNGSVVLYEKCDDPSINSAPNTVFGGSGNGGVYYRRIREFTLPEDITSDFINLSLSTAEEVVLCTLANSQTFSLQVASALSGSIAPPDVPGKSSFELFSNPVHFGNITGLDTCLRKPLIVTCSTDRSVRIWNFMDNTCEVSKVFSEVPLSVTMHPSGLYILIGFTDKLRLMNILVDDIRQFREFAVRGCKESRFSNGGQWFAAANGNIIQIYNTWTFESLAILKGHNGKVKCLTWSADDERLISCGADGAVYEWSTKDQHRINENINKNCNYNCSIPGREGSAIFAVGSDKTLKEIVDSAVIRELTSNVVLTQLVLSNSGRMLFAGTCTGAVRAIMFPFHNPNEAPISGITITAASEYQEHQGHSQAVSRLRVSFDDQFLFSTSEDGSVLIWKISERERLSGPIRKEVAFADEILVTKADLEEKATLIEELKGRVEELKLESEYQLRLKDMAFKEKIKEAIEKYQDEIESLKANTATLKLEKEKEEMRFEEETSNEKRRYTGEVEGLESKHSSKLLDEHTKFEELQNKAKMLEEHWIKQIQTMQQNKEDSLQNSKFEFEKLLSEKQTEIKQLQEKYQTQLKEFEEVNREAEEDAEQEILSIKNKYEKKLRGEREVALRVKGENGIMKKKYNTLCSEVEAHKGEIHKMLGEEKKMQSNIKNLEKDINALKKEILERDETIQDKEKRIFDLKKKNQELEKFKFVLDYKIKELRRQIEPREEDIATMSEKIKNMQEELSAASKSNAQFEMKIDSLKLKLNATEKSIQEEKGKARCYTKILKGFKVELNDAAQYIQEPKILRTKMRDLYHTYCKKLSDPVEVKQVAPSKEESDVNENSEDEKEKIQQQTEHARQRKYLERTITGLRKSIQKDQHAHKNDHLKIMQENIKLINEINRIRKNQDSKKASDKLPSINQ